MIKVITFDLDDTLWDVRPALVKAEAAQNAWLDTHYPDTRNQHHPEDLARVRRQVLDERPDLAHSISAFRQQVLSRLLLASGIPPDEAENAAQQAFQAFIDKRNDVDLFPQSVPVLTALSATYSLGALTNGNADVKKTPLGGFFDFALKAEDVGAAKPETALFDHAMRTAGVGPGEMLHVGDSHDHDVTGAYRAGVRSVWFSKEGGSSDLADFVIGCLTELPGILRKLADRR